MYMLPPLYADFWYPLMGLVLCFVLLFCMTDSARKNSRLRMRNVCCLLRQLVCNSRLVSFHPSRYSVLPSLRFSIPTDPRRSPISRRAGRVSWTERNGEKSRNEGETHVSSVTLPRSVNSYWSAVFLMCSVGRLPQWGGGGRRAHSKANTQRAGVIEISPPCFLCHVPPLSSISLSRAVDWSSSSCCLGLCHYPLCH